MRVSTGKDGNFSSYFEAINEDNNKNTSLNEILIDNQTLKANKR